MGLRYHIQGANRQVWATMREKQQRHYQFPWRGFNQAELLVDGRCYFPVMLEAIQQAQHYIALEMYLVSSGQVMSRFIDALLAAARREVDIFILLDDYGARGLKPHDRQRLQHERIRLEFYNPLHYGELRRSLFRDHRKLLLIDGTQIFVGGTGLHDAFTPEQSSHPWHELMLQLRGPCVTDWQTAFIDNWPGANIEHIQTTTLDTSPSAAMSSNDLLGRVTLSRNQQQEIKRSLLKRIRSAEHWVWIASAYFVPSWKIRRALRQAARRGVDVRLILPGRHTDHPAVRHAGRRFYRGLLRNGVRVFEYQPRFNHSKIYLADHWCSIGSSNVDRWNLLWNLEANQEIDDHDFALRVMSLFKADLRDCHEILAAQWKLRPWYTRLQEWFWGRIDLYLQRISARKRKP